MWPGDVSTSRGITHLLYAQVCTFLIRLMNMGQAKPTLKLLVCLTSQSEQGRKCSPSSSQHLLHLQVLPMLMSIIKILLIVILDGSDCEFYLWKVIHKSWNCSHGPVSSSWGTNTTNFKLAKLIACFGIQYDFEDFCWPSGGQSSSNTIINSFCIIH